MSEFMQTHDYRLDDGTLSIDTWRQIREVGADEERSHKKPNRLGTTTVSLLRMSENKLIERIENRDEDYDEEILSSDQVSYLINYLKEYQAQDLENERLYLFELATNLTANGASWEKVLEQIDLCTQHLRRSTPYVSETSIEVFTPESVANLGK